MLIDYNGTRTFTDTLDIVDPGHTVIKCINENGYAYYLIVETVRGQLHFFSFGPISSELPGEFCDDSFELSYSVKKWSEKTLRKEISQFLNDPYKTIYSAEETVITEAFTCLPDLQKAFEAALNN